MPLPKPRKEEDEDKFMERCLSNKNSKKEFPKMKQRIAVCMSQFKNKDKDE